jgi:eukaryotic-like serine/threonine-protein kinase
MALRLPVRASHAGSAALSKLDSRLADFESSWRTGSQPRAEDWLDRHDPLQPAEATELIYREFCLAESDGSRPRPGDYIARFPAHRAALACLFELHDLSSPASNEPVAVPSDLPQAGDEIGPYLLIRELASSSPSRSTSTAVPSS